MLDINILIGFFTSNPYSTLALILSTAGAFLVSSRSQNLRFWGFNIWIVSNGLIGYNYYLIRDIPLTILFLGFYQICNFRGILSNGGKELILKFMRK